MLGKTLKNRYCVIEKLGSGGFGDTYLAEDRDLPGNPQCVVKHLQPKTNDPKAIPEAKRLFDGEAQILYELGRDCDRIPQLLAHFQAGSEFYLVQEFVDGHDLTQELTPSKILSESYTIALLQGLLEVLEIVHGRNIIHRDIKPQNVMRRRRDGKIVLIDFGAVKQIGSLTVNSQGQTSLTISIGTPGYAPGEQAKGKPKLSSDIYAVGMLGIQALTGVMPDKLEEDDDTGQVVWRDLATVSDELALVLERMVRDRHSERYANATEALAALVGNVAPPVTVVQPPPPPPKVSASPPPLPTVESLPPPTVQSPSPSNNVFGKMLGWLNPQPAPTPAPKRASKTPSPSKPKSTPKRATTIQTFTYVTVNRTGKIDNRYQGQAEVMVENLGNRVTLEMVYIPGGSFLMGSPETELERRDSESPQHRVSVPPFYLGKYPVTQGQYQAITGSNPSRFKGANRPLERVTWNDAVEFCQGLSRKTGKKYRLPSEAEWEYACRAGTTTPFHFGETITPDLANYRGNSNYGSGPKGVYRQQTTDVGSFPPNAFGLYDMHGNVWELCQDVWHSNYNGAPTDGSAWETGGDSKERMLRGGSWCGDPRNCRCADRYWGDAGDRDNNFGFRVLLVPGV